MKRLLGLILALSSLVSVAHPMVSSVAVTVGQWMIKDTERVYYVRVEGRGQNNAQARSMAFRKAVELAVGTIVLGETVVNDNNLTRDEIISYSSGYINDFKVISETDNTVVVDVWVSDSRIANRLEVMGNAAGGRVDGQAIRKDWERRNAQIQSDTERQSDAKRVIGAVLADYPRAAFNIKIASTHLGMFNGAPALIVDAKIEYNALYAKSLTEVAQRTRHGTYSGRNNTDLQIEEPWLNFTRAYWNDNTRQMWVDTFNKPVSMELNFGDHVACWNLTKLLDGDFFGYTQGSTYVINTRKSKTITFNFVNQRNFNMSDDAFVNWIGNMNKVEARIVDSKNCQSTK